MVLMIEYTDDLRAYDVLSITPYELFKDAKLAFLDRKAVFESLGDDVTMNTIGKDHFTWINANDPTKIIYHCRILEF